MAENQETKICPFCAEKIKAEAVKCRFCGSDLTQPPPDPSQPTTPPENMTPVKDAITGMTKVQPGCVLANKYKIVSMIGRGGMGCVYQGQEIDFNIDRSVAIKVLLPTFTQDEKTIKRFEEEIKIAASLDHPNIVPIYNVAREGDCLFFVMKYLGGQTLRDKIKKKGMLSEKAIRKVANRISDALGYLHNQGCIHRDIKSNNIMFDSTGHPILMDFGIAKKSGGEMLTTEGEILGTATYMAPEQWHGKNDSRSDIYSFGCVLYEAAAGRPPFVGETIPELMNMHLNNPAPPINAFRSDLSPELSNLILKCLEKNPEDRIQSMQELNEAIQHLDYPPSTEAPQNMDETVVSTKADDTPVDLVQEALREADWQARKGRIDKAIAALNKQVEKGRSSAELNRKLERLKQLGKDETRIISEVESFLSQKQHDRAQEMLEGFLEQVESTRVRMKLEDIRKFRAKTTELYNQGRKYQSAKKYDKAYRAYQKVLERDPRHPGATAKLKAIEEQGEHLKKTPITTYIAIGAAVFVLIILFVVVPLALPGPISGMFEGMGDTFFDIGWYKLPPLVNAVFCYRCAWDMAPTKRSEARIERKWNKMYNHVMFQARAFRAKGDYSTSISYYKIALKLFPKSAAVQAELQSTRALKKAQ